MSELRLTPVLAERLHLVEGLAPFGAGPPSPEDFAKFMAFAAPVDGYEPPDAEIESATVAGPHGDIPVRIYRPEGPPRAGLVWAHGGAFVAGDLDMPESDVVARELAANHGIQVVAVDYRLCHGGIHFPIPHDDVHAAFEWARTSLDPGVAWAIGGASAGGNLAAGVAQRLRDEPGDGPIALVLAYGVVHAEGPPVPAELEARIAAMPAALTFPQEGREWIHRNFLGEQPVDTPYAFAGHGSAAGLAPTLVILPDHDDLTPSGREFARQILEAGGDVEVEEVVGTPHGHLNFPGLAEALTSIGTIADFVLRRAGATAAS